MIRQIEKATDNETKKASLILLKKKKNNNLHFHAYRPNRQEEKTTKFLTACDIIFDILANNICSNNIELKQ